MRLLTTAIILLMGCSPTPLIPDGHDAGGVDCANNSQPFIANLEMNSLLLADGDDGAYALSLHFDWADPGVSGGSDRPNMSGGYVSGEEYSFQWPTWWFTPEDLVSTCIGAPADICAPFGHGANGCASVDDLESCTRGELTLVLEGTDEPLLKYQDILLEFRIRDRCGDTSNFKLVEYEVGSGHLVESAPPADE
jgi:hypothetical protein